MDREVRDKAAEWLESFGNPSSIHWAGREPKALIREARQNVAKLLGVEPLELVFTGGGSEANNFALKGLCTPQALRKQIVISAVEHPSVRKTAEALRDSGFEIDIVGVSREGMVDWKSLENLVSDKTLLVSFMFANNETGHIYPIQKIVQLAHARGALVHTDAVQALGKIPFSLRDLGVDLATISGHKFYALKGCGVLFVRKGLSLTSLVHGGGQERGRRAGTENLLAIASLGQVCAKSAEISAQGARLRELRDHMEKRIVNEIEDVVLTGPMAERVPNTSSMCIKGVDGETLLMNLDVRGFAVSTGAACSSGNPEPSPILLAMGFSREEAQSSLRLSLGWGNTKAEVDSLVDELIPIVARLRGFRTKAKAAHGV